eukprot:jgi/Botrbrau1/10027/Bobra.0012s0114.1
MEDPSSNVMESPDGAEFNLNETSSTHGLEEITGNVASSDADLEHLHPQLLAAEEEGTTSARISAQCGDEYHLDPHPFTARESGLVDFGESNPTSTAESQQVLDEGSLGEHCGNPLNDHEALMQSNTEGALEDPGPARQKDNLLLQSTDEALTSDREDLHDQISTYNPAAHERSTWDAGEAPGKSQVSSLFALAERDMDSQVQQGPPNPEPETGEDPYEVSKMKGRLPGFLNKENRMLEEEVLALEDELKAANAALKDITDRKKLMAEHLANVKTEVQYTHSQLVAREKEINTEKNLSKLKTLEKERYERELSRWKAEHAAAEERTRSLQAEMVQGQERLDQFRAVMNWNQEELAQWVAASAQKEEDVTALSRYQGQDDKLTRDLTLQLERVTQEMTEKKKAAEDRMAATQAAQVELDTMAEGLRSLQRERLDLLAQWEEALAVLHRCRHRSWPAEREIARTRNALAAQKERLAKAGTAYSLAAAAYAAAQDEAADLQAALASARAEVERKQNDKASWEEKVERMKHDLKSATKQLGDKEALLRELELVRKADEARLQGERKALAHMQAEKTKKANQLASLRQAEKEISMREAGFCAQARNLDAKIARLDEKVVRMEEIVYKVDYELAMLERKVARAGGHRSEEETQALHNRINSLESQLAAATSHLTFLVAQLKKVEDEVVRAKATAGVQNLEKEKLQEAIMATQLETDTTSRSLKAAVKEKEKAMVDQDCLQVEVRRLRMALVSRAEQVFALEARLVELRSDSELRKQHMMVEVERLQLEIRLVKEEGHRLSLDYNARLQKAQKLNAKYDTVVAKHASCGGEEHSQAYFLIKAAQEKEELKRDVESWETKVATAEKEVAGLRLAASQLASSTKRDGSQSQESG